MATANGVLGPHLHSERSASPSGQLSKRKREDDSEQPTNGDLTSTADQNGRALPEARSMIRDLIDVLKGYDTFPSILDRSIPDRPSSDAPDSKRQKSEDAPRSILTRLAGNTYTTVDRVLEDIDMAASAVIETLRSTNGNSRYSGHQAELVGKVTAFKQKAHDLVKREKSDENKNGQPAPNIGTYSANYHGNGGLGLNSSSLINTGSDGKTVLTLYGTTPSSKQLFSSLQLPAEGTAAQKDLEQTLRETGLPKGFTITKILSADSSGAVKEPKRVPTLGELFPTPSTVPALLPPQPSKIATTRTATVGWYQPVANDALPRSASYSRQSIACGQWLDYSNVSSSSQGTKRKRDRALSLVGAKAPVDLEPVESESAKLDALFRSAYSGFAPTKDDAMAVAPAGMLNRIWWRQKGEKAFENMVECFTEGTASDDNEPSVNDVKNDDSELQAFEKMVEELENEVDPTIIALEAGVEKSAEEKDVEEVLQGISELLETLNSYQRIRHMSLNAANRPASILSLSDSAALGTPTKPSDSEQATYEILRSQLTLMIATLPPFAVAKLDPDRLADLGFSTKIEVQLKDYKGVMEEDEAAARVKAAAAAAASASNRPVPATSSHRPNPAASLYGGQYAPRPGPTAPPQYYGSSQTPIRPPPSNIHRPPATAPAPYQPQRAAVAAAASYRPGPTYGTPTYPHQNPRPVHQGYGANNQQYLQTPSGQPYMQTQSQSYQHGSQTVSSGQMGNRYSNQAPYAHQSPVPQNNMQYRYPPNNAAPRQVSPQKPMYSPQPVSAQPRHTYSTPTPPVSQARPYMQAPMGQPSMMNGSSSQASTPGQYAPIANNSTSGYNTFMTEEQQSSLMDRQRSLIASGQTTQTNVRSATMTNANGAQVNGNSAVAAGL